MIGLSVAHPVPVPESPPGVQWPGSPLPTAPGAGGDHVGVGPVLEQGQGQGIDKVEILGGASVLDHVHQGQQDVVRPLGEPDVRVQAVL